MASASTGEATIRKRGRTMFGGIDERVQLRLAGTRSFGNGVVLLRYEAA